MEEFEIPEIADLSRFTVSAITQMQAQARTAFDKLMGETTQDNVDADKLAALKALRQFGLDAQAEIDGRNQRAAEFAALTEPNETAPATEETPATETAPAVEAVTAGGEGSWTAPATTTTTTTTAPVVEVSLSDISGGVSNVSRSALLDLPNYGSIVAAADVPGYATGQSLDGIDEMAKAFVSRTNGYAAHRGGKGVRMEHQVAMIRRDLPSEMHVFGQSEMDDTKIIEAVTDESKLPGGSLLEASKLRRKALVAAGQMDSLTAAVAWCSPSTTIYDTCLQITTDGIADFPEVQAPRGGVRHNQGIEFDGIFGDGTGFFNYTEAQIISGVTKPCLTIDCPPFVDERLGVTGLCLTGNILQNRAYPEYVATFIRGALASSAHQINMLQIAAVVTGSTAVNLTAAAPWTGDGTVVSQVYSAVEMAIVDIKYRLRLQRSATLEVKMPFWVLAQMRADWIRRNATQDPDLADSMIADWFATRGAVVDFVYDWQDAFSGGGVGPGADTPITALPTQLVFLVYPAGTWVRAVSDVITLNSVYDSTKLASNQLTQLFTETGWKMLRMCTTSRAYTVNICPSGESGAQRTSANTIAC